MTYIASRAYRDNYRYRDEEEEDNGEESVDPVVAVMAVVGVNNRRRAV